MASYGDILSGISTGISSIGGSIADFGQAAGDRAEADAFSRAAQLETANEAYAAASTNIQTIAAQRRITKTLGAQQAAVGASGFEAGGTANYLLRESVAQGAMTTGLVGLQGALQEASFQEQALADQGKEQAAKAAAAKANSGGFLGILSGIAGVASKFF